MRKKQINVVPVIGILLAVTLAGCSAFGPDKGMAGESSSTESASLSVSEPSASHPDGLTITLMGEGQSDVTLGSIPRDIFLSGEQEGILGRALAALPNYLDMKSPIYTLEVSDGEANVYEIAIDIPNDSDPLETLDLYGWNDEAGEWQFIAGRIRERRQFVTDVVFDNVAVFQTMKVAPVLSSLLETNQVLDETTGSTLNVVFPTGLTVQADGSLNGVLAPGWQFGAGYAVMPVIYGDWSTFTGVVNNEATRALHISDLVAFAASGNYNGVVLDYQGLTEEDSAAYTAFLAELVDTFDEHNKQVFVIVPTPVPDSDTENWRTRNYDLRAIGQIVDAVLIQAELDPRQYASDGRILRMLSWTVGEVSRFKVHVIFTARSIKKLGDDYTLVTYNEVLDPLGNVKVETETPEGGFQPDSELAFSLDGDIFRLEPDLTIGAYTYKETEGDGESRSWIITANVIRARLDILSTYNIGGMSISHLAVPDNDAGILNALNEFKVGSVSTVPNQMVIQWSIEGESGAVLTDSTELGNPLTWKVADAGEYTVKGEIVGGRVSNRGEVRVVVGAEEEEPEPTRVASNNPPPANTPAPAPTQAPPPPAAAAGGAGGFVLGGQVANSLANASLMQHAGMGYVKFQAKWPYVDAATAGSFVSAGHAAGFKVLLSIPGPLYPQSIDYNGYVEHLRAVASYGPDAIEVWNEMNLDREWPAGQIDPASYVNNMLAPAFNAIKSVSPGTEVIIGALAPTGFDNGTNAWSDQRYLQGLAAAGAANYANCVGAHHNSGTTAPSVRSGRNEGDHYSWYFLPTVEVTYNAMGGSLPVCVTEFGYLSPEGYGPLPQNFSWGADNTVAEQAAWLAEGVTLSRSLGYVHMLIIWNVNFTTYDSDPQAGYAIIRPGGGCPACDALAAVK